MNVLIQTNLSPFQAKHHFGGAETSLRLIASTLTAKGHHVVFVSNIDFTSIKGFRKRYSHGITLYEFGKMYVPFRERYKVKKQILKYRKFLLKKILQKEKIDIVHTYYNTDICKRLLALQPLVPFKLVVRIAGLKWHEDITNDPNCLEDYQRIFNRSDLLNFISEGLYQNYLNINQKYAYKLYPKSYFIGDIGVEMLSDIQNKQKKSSEIFRALMISRFTPYAKRQDILVEAMDKIRSKVPIHLVLLGNGENKKNIQSLIISKGLENHIQIEPFTANRSQLLTQIKDADIVLHCSESEGLSKIIIETMSLGKPVLASNISPMNTYIKDGRNGYLIENEVESWASKLQDIYTHKEALPKIGANAREYIEKHYDASKNIDLYITEFETLINN